MAGPAAMRLVTSVLSGGVSSGSVVVAAAGAVRWLACGVEIESTSKANVEAFVAAGGVAALMRVLTGYAYDVSVCTACVMALERLCFAKGIRKAWVEAGGVACLFEVMRTYPGRASVQEVCCCRV